MDTNRSFLTSQKKIWNSFEFRNGSIRYECQSELHVILFWYDISRPIGSKSGETILIGRNELPTSLYLGEELERIINKYCNCE